MGLREVEEVEVTDEDWGKAAVMHAEPAKFLTTDELRAELSRREPKPRR